MKFEHKPEVLWPRSGTKRKKGGFLWFPKRIGDETRWLEAAAWEEKVVTYVSVFSKRELYWKWETMRWLDD